MPVACWSWRPSQVRRCSCWEQSIWPRRPRRSRRRRVPRRRLALPTTRPASTARITRRHRSAPRPSRLQPRRRLKRPPLRRRPRRRRSRPPPRRACSRRLSHHRRPQDAPPTTPSAHTARLTPDPRPANHDRRSSDGGECGRAGDGLFPAGERAEHKGKARENATGSPSPGRVFPAQPPHAFGTAAASSQGQPCSATGVPDPGLFRGCGST